MLNVNKTSIVIIIISSTIGCSDGIKNESKKVNEKYVLSENFTEEEYLEKVKMIKGDDYYAFSKEELYKWDILMRKVNKDSLVEGDVIALFDSDSNLTNQILITEFSKKSISVNFKDSTFSFANISSLMNYIKQLTYSFNFYRKKTGRGAEKEWKVR